ncbi:hypothetical protein O6H91_06G059300 [Diphasiastrum complanatum]|uniref:Uncharacterized protein n=1 Tax=Diphasiastrum complanatum TaxID=34168 RepID=A0ACC2DEI4_DIPCM|nr:hypothetical protein O6H91_06G059300 [Diphasiastrum complanatum]
MASSLGDQINFTRVKELQKHQCVSRKPTGKQSTTIHSSDANDLASDLRRIAPVFDGRRTKRTDVVSKPRSKPISNFTLVTSLEGLFHRKVKASEAVSCTGVCPSPSRTTTQLENCSDSSGSASPATEKSVAAPGGKQSILTDSDVVLVISDLSAQDSPSILTKKDAELSSKSLVTVSKEGKPALTSCPIASARTRLMESPLIMSPDSGHDDDQPALLQKSLTIMPKLPHNLEAMKIRCKVADMAVMVQEHALCCAQQALVSSEKLQFKRVASLLKQEFDQTYGPAWHCIVGSSFGSYVTHSVGGFFYFAIGKVSILLFKTSVQLIEH